MTCNKRTIASGSWCVSFRRLFWVVLLALLSMEALAVAQSSSETMMQGERPSRNGEPTVIEISVFVIDIDEIDDVNQRFSVDLFITARWQDHRLALPDVERKGKVRFMMIDDVWTPRVLVINNRGLTNQLREGVEVDDLGNMKYQNRVSGELKVDLEFKQFPLWNPYYCGGNAMLANPQSSFLNPLFIFVLTFGEIIGLKLLIFIYLIIGLFGMFLLASY